MATRKASADSPGYLSKREQQIMEIAYAREKITATDLEEALPGHPANSSVRTFLRILEKKGHMAHVEEEGRYVYFPTRSRQIAARSALSKLVDTFFGGSISGMFATLLSDTETNLTEEEAHELRRLIDEARSKEDRHDGS